MDETIHPASEISTPLDRQRREKLADQTLARAIDLGNGASKAALIWFVALAVIWWTSLEPQMHNLTALTEWQQRVGGIEAQIRAQQFLDELSEGQFENNQIPSDEFKSVSELRIKKEEAGKDVGQWTKKSETVSFKLPGLDPIKVPSKYAPLIWSVLVLGLLGYVAICRKRILMLCGRALRIYRELSVPQANLAGIAAGTPWWIAPLPRRDGSVTKRDDLLRAFGWPLGANRIAIWNGVAFVFLLLSHARVAWIAFRTNELIWDDSVSPVFGRCCVFHSRNNLCRYSWLVQTI